MCLVRFCVCFFCFFYCFFFQAEDGIRDLVRSRGLGDVYKRQVMYDATGTLIKSRQYGAENYDVGYGITADVMGNCISTGYFLSLIHI